MAKLSPGLKALINAPLARPDPTAAPARIADIYKSIAQDATAHNVSLSPWLAISVRRNMRWIYNPARCVNNVADHHVQSAATFTLNSPESLSVLHSVAVLSAPVGAKDPKVVAAEMIREVGLKCISFNGIPRTINCLNAFYASLPVDVTSQLSTRSTREPNSANLEAISHRGRALWNSIYAPFEDKLYSKLRMSHPDLPVHILNSHYGPLLSDPTERHGLAKTGRVLTSVIAIACLRAQTGVGPQVLSHVFGLRKGIEDGTYQAQGEEAIEGAEWLATDEGSEWILRTVDKISEALGGSNFAGAKL